MSQQPIPNPKFFSGQAYVCEVCGLQYETEIALKTWCTPSKHALLAQDEARWHAVIRSIFIELTKGEYQEAMRAAAKRTKRAIDLGRVGSNKQERDKKARDDKIGALGERAYCKWKGLPFAAMDHYPDDLRAETHGEKPADFGRVDVKAHQKRGWHLLVHEEDPIRYIFVSASADIGDFVVELCGWEEGVVVKNREKYWTTGRNPDRPPCYWFPDKLLQPMSTLESVIT